MKKFLSDGAVSRCLVAGLTFALNSLVSGCGHDGPSATLHRASGKVMLANGKPLTSGKVCFEPQVAPGLVAKGLLGPDGSFTLTTHREGDGAVEGPCRVYIEPTGEYSTRKGSAPFPPEFLDPESSNLVVEVKPGTNQFEPLVLKSKSATRAR